MTLDEWKALGPPESHWRARSRAAMQAAVREHEAGCKGDPYALIRKVDAAYPFGSRELHPYKMWLVERRIFIDALTALPAGPMPSADEVGVCEVARDLVELGRHDEARALVEQQAPNRLARKCPACAAPSRVPCAIAPPTAQGIVVRMTVPHHARLVGHLDAGPLFEERG